MNHTKQNTAPAQREAGGIAHFSFRLGMDRWMDENRFQEFLTTLDEYPNIADQLSLFTSESHPPLPLPVIRERMEIARVRMAEARRHGYACGVNLLSTIGHHNENLPFSLQGDMRRMTNIRGEAVQGVLCPRDERTLDYARSVYQLIVAAEPDFIWIDDDIRFSHMPIGYGCFCDGCVAAYNEDYGAAETRESLQAAFDRGDREVRLRWLAHNRRCIARLFQVISDTVPVHIPLGFMTGERYMEGYDFAGWAEVLSAGGRRKVMWRPGGGAYTDYRLHDFVDKAGEITRQTADLPGYITDIQSEIENFPYNVLKKGPYSTAMEACLYVAAGCTGAAFNVIPACTEDPAVVRALLEEIYRREPFMRRMAETFGRAPLAGVHTGWSRDGQAGTDRFYEGWPDHTFAREIFELGMPQAGPASAAQVYLLTLPNVRVMDDGRLREVLRTGAYVEPEALEELDRRGYAEYTGFRVREYRTVDSIEVYCDTPFHRGIFPGRRNGRQAFYRGTAAVLEPLSPDCQVLSCLTDYNGAVTAPCCMGLFENKLGGRICAAGYYPWAMLEDTQKSRQIRRIFDYLTRGKLISSVESFCRVHNWTRRLADGRVAVTLLNASLERLTGCRIRVRTTAETGCWVDMDGKETRLSSEPGPEGSRLFTLPDFAPWSLGMLVTDR